MLLDMNSYIGSWPFKEMKFSTCEGLLERMNKFGVDVSVVSNLNGIFYKNTQSANRQLYEEIKSSRKYADRFIPFATINPIYAGWKDDLKICANNYRMKGIRLYPKYHDYQLTDPSLIELVKNARDLGMTVAFTLRMVDNRQRSWMDIENEWSLKDITPIIREVPDAKYAILNIANSMSLNGEDTELLKNTNIVLDTSGRAVSNLGGSIKTFGRDKFAFGTHAPILDYLTGLLRIETLSKDEADKNTKELLRSGNARRILDL
jgi:predicted TIM-barrel fold metal-dependent hydrolase